MALIIVKDDDLCKGCEHSDKIDYELFCRVKTKGCINVSETIDNHNAEWVSFGKECKNTFKEGRIFSDLESILFNLSLKHRKEL